MAVNYGLGGFKDGLAYIHAYNNVPAEIAISAKDVWGAYSSNLTSNNSDDATVYSNRVLLNKLGFYLINFSVTTSASDDNDFTFGIGNTDNSAYEQGQQEMNSKAGDLWTTTGSAIIEVDTSGLALFVVMANNTNDENITVDNINLSVVRIGNLASGSEEFIGGEAFANVYNRDSHTLAYAAIDTWYSLGTTLFTTDSMRQIALLDTSFLEVTQEGYYYVYGSLSASGSSNDDLKIGVSINGDIQDYPLQDWNAKGGEIWQTGYSGIFLLNANDKVEMKIQNNTDITGNTTILKQNLVMCRIGNI